MPENIDKLAVICTCCSRTCEVRPLKDGGPALAPGWLHLEGKLYCADCRKRHFSMRTIALPVWSAKPDEGESAKDSWWRFLKSLRISFKQAAQVGTWAMRELAKADNGEIQRITDKDGNTKFKLPKLDLTKDLYGMARKIAPDLDSQSVGAVLQQVRRKYAETRWDQRVLLTIGLPKFGFPAPVPIPQKDAHVAFDDEENLWLSVRVSGMRFQLRLARNRDHHRQVTAIRKGLAGKARFGVVTLTGKAEKGGKLSDIKVRFTLEMPIERHEQTAVLKVTTAKERLWTVSLEGRKQTWNLNEDQVKKIVFAHQNRLQRLAEDSKFERRHPNKKISGVDTVRERITEKYANRMNDFCHKAAAMLVGFARRNHVGVIEYHEGSDRIVTIFPWAKLRTIVAQKAAQSGISVVLSEASDGTLVQADFRKAS